MAQKALYLPWATSALNHVIQKTWHIMRESPSAMEQRHLCRISQQKISCCDHGSGYVHEAAFLDLPVLLPPKIGHGMPCCSQQAICCNQRKCYVQRCQHEQSAYDKHCTCCLCCMSVLPCDTPPCNLVCEPVDSAQRSVLA